MDKKEFEMQKQLIEMQKQLIELEHKFKMEEILYRSEKEKEMQRIRSAEIRKTFDRKQYNG